jgi:hypothetical protein
MMRPQIPAHHHTTEYAMGKNVSTLTGIALATAVAGLFTMTSVGSAFADEGTDAQVKCEKSTSCKGHGACQTSNNLCKGQNDCKGLGFTMQKDQETCAKEQEKNKAGA